jgi:hypothetical protein
LAVILRSEATKDLLLARPYTAATPPTVTATTLTHRLKALPAPAYLGVRRLAAAFAAYSENSIPDRV